MLVLWDLENQGSLDPIALRNRCTRLVPPPARCDFRAYACTSKLSKQQREKVSRGGWSLIDCPHKEAKQVADTRIVLDALIGQDGITLVSGDGDFAPLLFAIRGFGRDAWLLIDQKRPEVLHQDLLQACSRAFFVNEQDEEEDPSDQQLLVQAIQTATAHPSCGDDNGWCKKTNVGVNFHQLCQPNTESKADRKKRFREALCALSGDGVVHIKKDGGVEQLRLVKNVRGI